MKISRARTFKAALVLLLAGALTNFFLAPVRAALPDTVHLTIHYQRTNADYTDWNVYLWKDLPGSANDKEVSAAGFPFQSEDSFGKIAKIDVTGTAAFDQIGIIIRRGAWAEKEGSLDDFIDNIVSSPPQAPNTYCLLNDEEESQDDSHCIIANESEKQVIIYFF